MEIEKSSKLIKTIYDEDDDDSDTLDYSVEIKNLFNAFSNGKKLTINFDQVVIFLDKFNKIHKNEIFKNFYPPLVQEYFCKQLNFLLIIDFILTFYKVDDINFDVKKLSTQVIFDFFINLGDFYNFMNYLDVDESFLNYLKYMIILYSFQLDRNIIEEKFFYFVSILDEFLQNVIMPELFRNIRYKNVNSLTSDFKECKYKFSKEIDDYDDKLCYNGEAYAFLDDLFFINSYCCPLPINVKTKTIEIVNPRPRPLQGLYYSEDEDEYYDNYEDNYWQWTPTIKKTVPVIENDDPNFEEYKKLFALRNYQKIKTLYDEVIKEIKTISGSLQLNKYDAFEPENTSIEIMKIKTILGCMLDYTNISINDCQILFGLACEYGHLEIVNALICKTKGDIGDTNFEKALMSPNRAIRRYLVENKALNKLNEMFTKYEKVNYYEPKIKFN